MPSPDILAPMRAPLGLVLVGLLAGCASNPEPASSPAPSPSAVTSTATATQTVSVTVTPSAPSAPATSASSAPPVAAARNPSGLTPAQEQLQAELSKGAVPGDTVHVNGVASSLCTQGDGYGLRMVSVGPNTSCDFGLNVMGALASGLNSRYDNVKDALKPTVEVRSPVTDQMYTMKCSLDESSIITCSGGNNAVVYLY